MKDGKIFIKWVWNGNIIMERNIGSNVNLNNYIKEKKEWKKGTKVAFTV